MSALHKEPSLCHSLRQPNWTQTLYVHYASTFKVLKSPALTHLSWKAGEPREQGSEPILLSLSRTAVAPSALLSFTIGWGPRCTSAGPACVLCIETLQCSWGAQLCLLSCQSPRLCSPPTVARQAPLSTGFSRQEHCSGLPFPSAGHLLDPGI